MANIDFKLPDLGEGVHEGQVMHVHVREGETVHEDQPLMEVETDKAAVEIPSPQSGIIQAVHVKQGQIVNVGDVMITFGPADPTSSAANREESHASAGAAVATSSAASSASNSTESGAHRARDAINGATVRGDGQRTHRRTPASPAVRKLARQLRIDIETVHGSGPGGRVTRADVQQAADGQATHAARIHGANENIDDTSQLDRSRPAKRAAQDEFERIAATNLASRVPTTMRQPAQPSLMPSEITLPGEPASDQWGETSRLPISRARFSIAQTMNQSWTTIPHVTDCDDADVTELDAMRRRFNESDPRLKLSLLPFVVRAVATALRQHPIFNASFDEANGEIVYKRYINICIGVQTERGLVAPVLREADRYGVVQLNELIMQMIEDVRSGGFVLNDLRGGTFTISNAGAMGGSRYATPLITPPQVAVIAVGKSRKLPWVVDDQVVPRLIMPLSVSFDHRIIDGAEEIAFQQAVIRSLENPVHLM